MHLKTPLMKKITLWGEKATVRFNENIEFIISPIPIAFTPYSPSPLSYRNAQVTYKIENVKGYFEVLKSVYPGSGINIPFDNATKTFSINCVPKLQTLDFYIMAQMDFQTVVSVTHQLQIPKERFEFLEPSQMFVDNFVLSNSKTKNVSYKFYGKKIDKENIEIHIENPISTGVKINDINLMLSFIFEIPHSDVQNSVECESRPESISSNNFIENEEYENFSQKQFTQNLPALIPECTESESSTTESEYDCTWYNDMILITTDGKFFSFHHSFLSKHSIKFAQIYQTSESLPIIINLNLNSYFFQVAIDFLNGNSDPILNAIVENEPDIFFFSDEFQVSSLMQASLPQFQAFFINPLNVCQTIQMAFDKNCEETKKICKKFFLGNLSKINPQEFVKLSSEIKSYLFSS
uniref:BTB domain-containing protein n=1 Tax=Panagrolaimus davidi TaxID=227884 RepID=A0A914PP21_9BILA